MDSKRTTTVKLTPTQKTYLRAAIECDSVTNDRLRLQVLNKLRDMEMLEIFDMEAPTIKGSRKTIYHFMITITGRFALAKAATS